MHLSKSCLLTFSIFHPNPAQAAGMSASGENEKSEGSTSRPPPIQLQLPRRPATGAPPIILSLPQPAGAEPIVLRRPSPPPGDPEVQTANFWASLISREDEDAFVLSPTVTWALDVPPGQARPHRYPGRYVGSRALIDNSLFDKRNYFNRALSHFFPLS